MVSVYGDRFVRLGTASLLSERGGPFINLDKLDLKKYAARPCLARTLCDYMLYHEHNPKRALELCAHATASNHFEVCHPHAYLLLKSVTFVHCFRQMQPAVWCAAFCGRTTYI